MRAIREKLLQALAQAYKAATGHPGPLEELARWLEQEHHRREDIARVVASVPVRLDTVELLELVDLLDRYPHEQAARKAREEENRDWWRSWADARRRLRGTGERKARLSAALWCFGLIGERYGPRYNAHRIAFEYHQLIEGYFDPATQTHYPPIEPCEACQILRQRHGNPSADAVRKLLQRHGVRGLPSVC